VPWYYAFRNQTSTPTDTKSVYITAPKKTRRSSDISKIEDFRRLVETAPPFRDDNSHGVFEKHEGSGDPESVDIGYFEAYERFRGYVREKEEVENLW
jgi:hypothetical protein